MKTLARYLLTIAAAVSITGCASNWAARNEPVTFIPEVLKAIESAQTRPVKLTDSQREQLFQSLHGPVRHDFLSDDLQPDVWASWWYQHDKVTFVRYPKKDGGYYSYVSYTSDGQVFSAGGGRSGSAQPPWTQ